MGGPAAREDAVQDPAGGDGDAPAASYLDIAKILTVAAGSGADAVRQGNRRYSRVAMPQIKMSAKDLATSLTEKCPPARRDRYV